MGLAACAFYLSALGSASAAPLTIAVSRTPLSLPLYVAQAKGHFGQAGLNDVAFIDCMGGLRCMKLLLEGKADMATVGDVPLMFASFQRASYAVIGTFATSADDMKLVAAGGTGLSRPSQLEGKRIGVVKGSASQYFLDSYLLLFGIRPDKVTQVPLEPEELVPALAGGRVQAISAWEPNGFDAMRANKGASVLPNAGAYTLTFNLVARGELRGQREQEMVGVLKALALASADIAQNPGPAQALLRKKLGADQAMIDWVWPGLQFQLSLNQALIRTLESEARWAIREGHVPAQAVPNYLPYVHAAPLRSVKPDAVGLDP